MLCAMWHYHESGAPNRGFGYITLRGFAPRRWMLAWRSTRSTTFVRHGARRNGPSLGSTLKPAAATAAPAGAVLREHRFARQVIQELPVGWVTSPKKPCVWNPQVASRQAYKAPTRRRTWTEPSEARDPRRPRWSPRSPGSNRCSTWTS